MAEKQTPERNVAHRRTRRSRAWARGLAVVATVISMGGLSGCVIPNLFEDHENQSAIEGNERPTSQIGSSIDANSLPGSGKTHADLLNSLGCSNIKPPVIAAVWNQANWAGNAGVTADEWEEHGAEGGDSTKPPDSVRALSAALCAYADEASENISSSSCDRLNGDVTLLALLIRETGSVSAACSAEEGSATTQVQDIIRKAIEYSA